MDYAVKVLEEARKNLLENEISSIRSTLETAARMGNIMLENAYRNLHQEALLKLEELDVAIHRCSKPIER